MDRVLSEPASLSAPPTLGKKYLLKGNDFVMLIKCCFVRELEQETNPAFNYYCKFKKAQQLLFLSKEKQNKLYLCNLDLDKSKLSASNLWNSPTNGLMEKSIACHDCQQKMHYLRSYHQALVQMDIIEQAENLIRIVKSGVCPR